MNSDAVRDSARMHSADEYAAALFAPTAIYQDLISLAAFTGEINHIVRSASDAALGEIRLYWWRDALARALQGEPSGNPVLDTFAETCARHGLKLADVERSIEARAADLVASPPPDDAALALHLENVDGPPLAFAAQIAGVGLSPATGTILRDAARASGMARIARELPYFLSREQSPLSPSRTPTDLASVERWRDQISYLGREASTLLQGIRSDLASNAKPLITAVLPLALIEPYFRALQNTRHDPTRDLVELAPVARLWHLARAAIRGRL